MHAVKFYRRYWAAIGGLIFVDEFEVRHGIASLFRKN